MRVARDALDPAATEVLDRLLRLAAPVAERLRADDHGLFLVGGIVRDLVLGSGDFSDVDLTTDARPPAIKRAVTPNATSLWTQGERFGTIGAHIGEQAFEITTHRAEVYDETSRKPVVSFGDDLAVDLSRRDFTINAMAIDVGNGELIDAYGGEQDLAARVLRTPLDASISFTDDPLRMLRAARFIPRFDLVADAALVAAASALRDRLGIVSGERIHDELGKLLALPTPAAGLRFLADTGLLEQIGLGAASDDLDVIAGLPTPVSRRAGLLLRLSEAEARQFLADLRFSNVDRRVTLGVLDGARQLAEVGSGTPALDTSIRTVAARIGDAALDDAVSLLALIGVSEADRGELTARLAALRSTEDLDDRQPPLEGDQIMSLLGLEPGPRVGAALKHLELLRLERGPLSADEATAALQRWAVEAS